MLAQISQSIPIYQGSTNDQAKKVIWEYEKKYLSPEFISLIETIPLKIKRDIVVMDWLDGNYPSKFKYYREIGESPYIILLPDVKMNPTKEVILKFSHIKLKLKSYSKQFTDNESSEEFKGECWEAHYDENNLNYARIGTNFAHIILDGFSVNANAFDRKLFSEHMVNVIIKFINSAPNASQLMVTQTIKEYTKFTDGFHSQLKSQLTNAICSNRDEISSHYQAIQRNEQKIIQDTTLMRSLARKKEKYITYNNSQLNKILSGLINDGKFIKFVFQPTAIYGYTGDIVILYKGINFNLGKFIITIKLNGIIKMDNIANRFETYDHPHVADGFPCLGNIKTLTQTMIKDGDFFGLLILTYDFLKTYDKEGHYVSIGRWGKDEDLCNECENIRTQCQCSNCPSCGTSRDDCSCDRCPRSGDLMDDVDCEDCDSYNDGCEE